MNLAAHTPIEIKSDPGDDTEADLVTKALDDFKGAVDERLVALETKTANDNKLADRVKAVETRLNRPGVGVETKSANDNGEIERKAFISYVRKGIERMPNDEAKALTVANGPTAGYLAPVQFGAELIKAAHAVLAHPPVRQGHRRFRRAGDHLSPPSPPSSPRSGSARSTRAPQSAPVFEQVTLTPHEIAVYVRLFRTSFSKTTPMISKARSLPSSPKSFGILEGSSVRQRQRRQASPMGLLASPQIATMASVASGKIGIADIIAAYHALPSTSMRRTPCG